jgi:hypothetical protein
VHVEVVRDDLETLVMDAEVLESLQLLAVGSILGGAGSRHP